MSLQVVSGGEDFVTDVALRGREMFVVTVAPELLSPLAGEVTLVTVDDVVTALVSRQLTGELKLLATSVTSEDLLHPPRVNVLDMRRHMAYCLVTFRAVMHFLEVNGHVLDHALLQLVLVVAEAAGENVFHPLVTFLLRQERQLYVCNSFSNNILIDIYVFGVQITFLLVLLVNYEVIFSVIKILDEVAG